MSLPLGLSIASHSGLTPAAVGAVANAAEGAGFTAVFVAEGHGDALAMCHPVVAATRRVRVGTAIANAALRPPVLAAKTAAQLDHASDGRFILGLGVANTVMNERFGIAPFAPLAMIEEYTGVVRAVLAGSPTGYDGKVFRTGMVPLDSPPVRTGLPIYLAALGPRMLELAGRIADGVILNLMTPAQAGHAVRAVRASARAAGRDPASVEIACVLHCCLTRASAHESAHDGAHAGAHGEVSEAAHGEVSEAAHGEVSDGARNGVGDGVDTAAAARAIVLRYVLHPAAPRLFGELDGGPSLARVRELVLAGDRAGAADAVPQQVADGFVIRGGADDCLSRVSEYVAAGVDLPVLFPVPADGDWGYEQTIAAMAGKVP